MSDVLTRPAQMAPHTIHVRLDFNATILTGRAAELREIGWYIKVERPILEAGLTGTDEEVLTRERCLSFS